MGANDWEHVAAQLFAIAVDKEWPEWTAESLK